MQKSAVCPVDSLALALREQLIYDRDSDSLTTSPSSSSLDTCSNQKIPHILSQCSGSGSVHREMSVTEDVREAGKGIITPSSETDGCNNNELKLARSVTDGELRHRNSMPLSQHGVSRGESLLGGYLKLLC